MKNTEIKGTTCNQQEAKEEQTMWKFSHTMLTSDVMDYAEEMFKNININDEQKKEIEHSAYVACMNEDVYEDRIKDFIRVLGIHHVTPEEITTTETTTEAQEATTENNSKEEQTMKNTREYRYEIRQLDAWGNAEDGYDINESWHMGEMTTKAENVSKAFTAWMKRHLGITFKNNRTLIEYDGDCYTIIDRKTKEPLFIAIPNY